MDPEKDKAIAAAVRQVLAEVGYSGLTMDEVAMVAGVGKSTIYRRWSSKADLLVSFTETASLGALASPDTGSLRDDLVALLTSICKLVASPAGPANRSLLSSIHDNPALFEAYRRGPLDRWSAAFAEVFGRAVDRGEMWPEAATSVSAEAGPAILIARWLITGRELNDALVTSVVDEVMLPLLQRAERAAAPTRRCIDRHM